MRKRFRRGRMAAAASRKHALGSRERDGTCLRAYDCSGKSDFSSGRARAFIGF